MYEEPRHSWPPSDGSRCNWWRLQILNFPSVRSSPAFFYVLPLAFKIPLSLSSLIAAFIFIITIIIIIIITRNYDTFYNKH